MGSEDSVKMPRLLDLTRWIVLLLPQTRLKGNEVEWSSGQKSFLPSDSVNA